MRKVKKVLMMLVTIELLQGDNAPIVLQTEISGDCKLTEVSGTLAYRIIKLRQKAQKYKMNLGGFSFSRKFDVKITSEGVSASGSQSLGLDSIKFGITIQNNEKSADHFHEFINDLVLDILTGESKIEGNFKELKQELCLN